MKKPVESNFKTVLEEVFRVLRENGYVVEIHTWHSRHPFKLTVHYDDKMIIDSFFNEMSSVIEELKRITGVK